MPSSTTTTTKPTPPTELRATLSTLGLHRLAESFDDFVAHATRARFSVVQVVEEIVRTELDERARRSVARHLGRAHLGRYKPMADFDWNWPRAIDRAGIERVLTLDFIERGENVVLVASHGLGKTMIAKNIAHATTLAGHSALFVSASDLLLDLVLVEQRDLLFVVDHLRLEPGRRDRQEVLRMAVSALCCGQASSPRRHR